MNLAGFSSPAEIRAALSRSADRAELQRHPEPLRETGRLMPKGRCGRRGLPDDLVAVMYRDYQRLQSLSKVAKVYGRTRQMMWDIFHLRGLPMRSRNFHARISFAGQYWTPGKNGYYRSTIRRSASPPLHYLIWEHSTGRKVPPGWQVSFKDADVTNLRSSNLFCAPKAEVTLYHYRRKYPERAQWTAEDRRKHKNAQSLNWWSRNKRRRREELRGKKRIVEVAHCCGQKYSRWRYEDSHFPAGHTICCECRRPILWKSSSKTLPSNKISPRGPRLSPVESAWRALRAEMDVPRREFLSVLER